VCALRALVRRPAMRQFAHSSLAVAAALASAVSACTSEPPATHLPHLEWSRDTLTYAYRLLRRIADPEPESRHLSRPVSVRAFATELFVADLADDRIAVLDSSGQLTRWIGRRGGGPGELYGVSRLAVFRGAVLVGEALNGRVSTFDTSGAFVGTFVAPFAAGSVVLGPDGPLAAIRAAEFYAARLLADGLPEPVLARPTDATPQRASRWRAMPGHDLLASDSSGTWVFDQARLILCHYVRLHSRPRCTGLPSSLTKRLESYREARVVALESATGQRVAAAPVVKDIVRVAGLLALLLPLPELPIVLVNPDDATLTPVATLSDAPPDWVRSARAFAWDGRSFVLVGDDALGRLHLSRIPLTE
jgi:hypothetical protein